MGLSGLTYHPIKSAKPEINCNICFQVFPAADDKSGVQWSDNMQGCMQALSTTQGGVDSVPNGRVQLLRGGRPEMSMAWVCICPPEALG